MSSESNASLYESISKRVTEQGELVRKLKTEKADKTKIDSAVEELKKLKTEQIKLQPPVVVNKEKQLRLGLEDLLIRRFFYVPAFEIYGGVAGLYDFGPAGCAVKQNLIQFWRQHFVLTESMLEVDCAAMTPEPVLIASGHVAKFSDFMVRDEKTSECFRADKILEDAVDKLLEDKKNPPSAEKRAELLLVRTQAGAMKAAELHENLTKYNVKSPDTGNNISEPQPYNLMFKTSIGPTGKLIGYLRPETAQGIFVNFRRLLDFNQGRIPFAAAQIGLAFRNEIAPRAGLLRVREFTLAEIEHFVHPNDKRHSKFKDISDLKMSLLGRADQTGEDKCRLVTAQEAVSSGLINNETLAYFMARTQLFLTAIGIKAEKLRFRQHKADEMAHYAADCWDAEIHGSYGWIECVGHADRSAFDLEVHTKHSKVELIAQETYSEPKLVDFAAIKMNAPLIGKTFSGKTCDPNAKLIMDSLKQLESPQKKQQAFQLKEELQQKGFALLKVENSKGECVEVKIESAMVEIKSEQKKVSSEKYIPSVIEPSFGLGRILYHVFEHCYYIRPEDEQRGVLGLPPILAGHKVAILPISAQEQLETFNQEISKLLTAQNISSKIDNTSAQLGRRYARSDEIGIPFAVTVDFETPKDRTVTIRERDSTQQIRVKIELVPAIIQSLCNQTANWQQIYDQYPHVIRNDENN